MHLRQEVACWSEQGTKVAFLVSRTTAAKPWRFRQMQIRFRRSALSAINYSQPRAIKGRFTGSGPRTFPRAAMSRRYLTRKLLQHGAEFGGSRAAAFS